MNIVSGKRMCYDKVVRPFVKVNNYPHAAFVQMGKWLKDNVPDGEWYIESVRVGDWRDQYANFRKVEVNLEHLEEFDENNEHYHPNKSKMEIFYFDDEEMALLFKLTWAGLIDE